MFNAYQRSSAAPIHTVTPQGLANIGLLTVQYRLGVPADAEAYGGDD